MPTIRQLTCTIESGDGLALDEYGTSYTDGFVQTHVPVPSTSTPFSVHLVSHGYIAPGIALFVYIDGVYQCNRNRLNLKVPFEATDKSQYEVDLRVRQKEGKLQDGTWYGKEWRFERLNVVSGDAQETANAQSSIYDHIGTIEVVVRRCHKNPNAAPQSFRHYIPSSEVSIYSATDMSENILDLTPDSSPKVESPPSSSSSSSSSSRTSLAGFGLFDGANDKEESHEGHKAVQLLGSSLNFNLDGNFDDPHPPEPNGPRKEWSWSVQGNQGRYHKIGDQSFPQQHPQGRIDVPDGSSHSSSSTHFEQDWQEQRRDDRSRNQNSHRRSPSRRSTRHREVSPHKRPSSHRSHGHFRHQAPPGSPRASHAGDNGASTGWGGVPATGPSPAIIIQVQQAPQPAPSVRSRGRSQDQQQKPLSEHSRWPSLPQSVDSCATRMTPLTPSEIEAQRIRYGVKRGDTETRQPSSRASHVHSRTGDARERQKDEVTQWQFPAEWNQGGGGQQAGGGWGGNNENHPSRSLRSYKSSRSHHTSNKPSEQPAVKDWATNNLTGNNGNSGWGGDNGVNSAQNWGGNNNSGKSGVNLPQVSNNNGWGGAPVGNWGNTGGKANGQSWGAGNISNTVQSVPGAWATSPIEETSGAWEGGVNNTSNTSNANQGWDSGNAATTGTWNQKPRSDRGNNGWGGDANATFNNSNANQGWNSDWNPGNTATGAWDQKPNSNSSATSNSNQGGDSGNAAAGTWDQKPSPSQGNNDWNNTTNNDNYFSGANTWGQNPGSPVVDNNTKNWNADGNNKPGSALNDPNITNPQDWAAGIKKIFAKGFSRTAPAKPEDAPQPTSSPVHGFYSMPNSPVQSQPASPQPAPSHKGSIRPSHSASARKGFANTAEASFATVKPYWAKWQDSQTVKLDDSVPKEPSFTVSEEFIRETSTSHHVRTGKTALYTHRVYHPKYIDSPEEPYTVFVFKYRSKEMLEQMLGSPLSEGFNDGKRRLSGMSKGFNDEKSRLSGMSKDELVDELLKVKASSATGHSTLPDTKAEPAMAATSTRSRSRKQTPARSQAISQQSTKQNNTSNWTQPVHEPVTTTNRQRKSTRAQSTKGSAVNNWQAPTSSSPNNPTNNEMSAQDYENYVSGGTDWQKNHPDTANMATNTVNTHNNNSWNGNANRNVSPVSSVVNLDLGFGPHASPVASVNNGDSGWAANTGAEDWQNTNQNTTAVDNSGGWGGGDWQNTGQGTTAGDNSGGWGGGGEQGASTDVAW